MSRTTIALALVSSLSLFACAGKYGSSGPGAMAGAAPVGGDTTMQPQPWHDRSASREATSREPAHAQRDIRELAVHTNREVVTCRQCR